MRAYVHPLSFVLDEKQQWVVPVYQRHYEWEIGEDRQLPKLWEDLKDEALERLDARTPFPHYFGAIIYSEPQNQAFGAIRRRFLIDGQQRITTFQLVLAAIREVARHHKIERLISVVDAYLFNEKSPSMINADRERFKLWPSAYDRSLYQHIAEHPPGKLRHLQRSFYYKNGSLIKGQAPNLLRAYHFLFDTIAAFVAERTTEEHETAERVLEAVLAGFLDGFQVVLIHLDQNDDAQEIFASLNGLGKPLSPFDLIRNDVFHRARKTGEDDEKLFDERWKTFEDRFWTEQVRQGRFKRARADHLIAHAVVAETAREVNVGKIATEYQRYARERSFTTVADELDVLLAHAGTYRDMETIRGDTLISRIAQVLRLWDLSTFHPLVLAVSARLIEDEQKEELFKLLESYIVRREICGLTTKNYNKVVTGLVKQIREDIDPIGAFKKYLTELTGDASRMPNDLQVAESCGRRRVYGVMPVPRLRFILQNVEYGSRTRFDEVTVPTDDLQIEHIMPQKWSTYWPLPSGETAPFESTFEATIAGQKLSDETKAWIDARQRLIDTLGNLTLLNNARNPSLGNSGWVNKRAKLKESLLALNRNIAAVEEWGELEIERRAVGLASIVVRLWSTI
jgi:hypothetical protein